MDFLGVMDRETARSRSSTWPLPDPTQLKVEMEEGEGEKRETPECESPVPQAPKSEPKKMRNAWGNMSYAELITQAILTAPETKLTLSEIYDWIVHNVPYFADKANSPSTAGWKNSVRHNLSLHSRFVKIQNENSGKSSWWTVDLDAKSGRTSRRNRSHSVDNTNTPSPKSKKREKRSKLKKVKGASSTNDILSSPCHSPTASQPRLQPPWSPNPSCPSPTGSDLSPCASPFLQSPVLPRNSRNVTPVSPLVSPPGLDQQNGILFSGSNSSLLDDPLPGETGDPAACVDLFAQLNLRSSREHMGSSSSLSSLNSPRLLPVTKSPHPIFTFNNPSITDSSGYSSSAYFSDTDIPEAPLPPPLPTYEEHMAHTLPPQLPPAPQPQPPHRPMCYTPTRTHPLQFSIAADTSRPRSGSEPVPVNLVNRFPMDLDMNLFDHPGFDCDMDSIIRSEIEHSNGALDFQFDQQVGGNDPTLTSVALQNPVTTIHAHTSPMW